MKPSEILIRAVDAARAIGVSQTMIRHWTKAGALLAVSYTGAGKPLYRASDIARFALEREETKAAVRDAVESIQQQREAL
jgi:predicted site-specific integrase-resolvase